MRRRRVILAGSILAVLAVGACSHSSHGSNSVSGGGGQNSVNGAAVGAGGAGSVDRMAPAQAAPKPQGTSHYSLASAPIDDGTAQIRTAEMRVAVKGWRNVTTKADEAGSIALRLGGEVDGDNRSSGRHATATLLLRVPPDELRDTLAALSKLGIEQYRHESTTDVTEKVADVRSRVQSAQLAIAELRELFDKARKISDIIEIESDLNQREADLESFQAQYRALTRQTSMAAITLSLVTARKAAAPPPKKEKKHRGGFVGGLERGWDGFTAFASWIATAVGTLLPFLVLLLVLALGARALWPRLPRRTGRAPMPTPSDV